MTRRSPHDGFHFVPEFGRREVSVFRILIQCSQHDLVQTNVDFDSTRRWQQGSSRQLSGQHFVQHDSQRIDIRAMVDSRGLVPLFGGHVSRSAQHGLASEFFRTRPGFGVDR